MSSAAHYFELSRRGKVSFRQEAAPAALVRDATVPLRGRQQLGDNPDDATWMVSTNPSLTGGDDGGPNVDVYPLEKKADAAFSRMITVGRTRNNDVVLDDVTISRFHAYFAFENGGWLVCDAGSKNGSQLSETALEIRQEVPITSGSLVQLGDVKLTFHTADDLYDLLTKGP